MTKKSKKKPSQSLAQSSPHTLENTGYRENKKLKKSGTFREGVMFMVKFGNYKKGVNYSIFVTFYQLSINSAAWIK